MPLTKEERLAPVPSPKTLVAHLDQFVTGQEVAKRRIAVGVSNHFKRVVDTWDRDAPDPIIADVRMEIRRAGESPWPSQVTESDGDTERCRRPARVIS